jgi:uncharacterized DUF497 family protein
MKITEILKNINKSDILVSEKVRRKIEDRGLSIDEVLDKIFDLDNLIVEAKQNGSYELIYKYSGKYTLVIILFINSNIRLATAWKSSKKIDKLLKKATYIYDYKKRITLNKINK